MLDLLISDLAEINWLFLGLASLTGIAIAHVVGYFFAQALAVEPGHAREVMPSLPVAPMQKGKAAARFDRSVLRAERRLLREFRDGATGVEATSLAAAIQEDPIVVSAALERMREEIPCRLRITASGRILHDFAAADVAKLRRKRRAWLPVRLMVFGLAGLANVGAIWPVLLILTLALWTLDVAVSNATETAVQLGLVGLVSVAVAFGVAMLLGWLTHLLLTPIISAPELGKSVEDTALSQRRVEKSGSSWVWFTGGSSSSSSNSSSSSKSSSSSDSDGGGGGAAQLIIIIIAIAIIVLCTVALVVWGRGLWRAISRDDRELDRMSPARWVRKAVTVDMFERFIPTNDLVGRVYRALARAHSHRRPVDEDLGPRVMELASRRLGRASAVEIALGEALDIDEAAEVGARLTALLGGEILVSDAGDLVFQFPPEVRHEFDDAKVDEDMWAEYLNPEPLIQNIWRRGHQGKDKVPVNLVGLTYEHLVATDRLVGGTLLMAVSGSVLLNYPGLLDFQLFRPLTHLLAALSLFATPISVSLFAFAIGAMALSAAARYTARATAIHGVQRDIRRATFEVIRKALSSGDRQVDLEPLPARLRKVFRSAWGAISQDDIEKEVHAVLVDLDLSPSLEAGGRLVVELGPLRSRYDSARTTGTSLLGGATPQGSLDDEIVFETEITHDRIKVLA